jgi:hypothetical protein
MCQVIRTSGFALFACIFLPLLAGHSQHSPVVPYHLLLWDRDLFHTLHYCWPYFLGLIAALGTLGLYGSERNSAWLWCAYALVLTAVVPTLWLTGGRNLTHFGRGPHAGWLRDTFFIWPLLALAATAHCPTWRCAALLFQWCLALSACVWFFYVSRNSQCRAAQDRTRPAKARDTRANHRS